MVKLTQEQADFLKTFNDKSRAFYYISSWGWGNFLKNGIGEVYENGVKTPFTIDEKEKMLNAIINGYEVIEPKFKFYNFSDSSGETALYYAGRSRQLTKSEQSALEVKEDSEEYKALLTLGFIKEEV
ncbi:hypothetical protein [Lactococcus phage i0139]|uniref:Uncharacterized protein n=1 Tax=Lactococcus phage i0139 TaxID=1874593 RepID=A0A2H4ESN8_9CAUD|nr:hypothetical protein HYP02_gp41 [Lactococcus phage i0139]ALM63601.1 hypothetical protein Phi129_42 [Lactococcus phage 936 group phage Phi129]ANY28945.1 hypothetical protein [Lactococcus phage i0139]